MNTPSNKQKTDHSTGFFNCEYDGPATSAEIQLFFKLEVSRAETDSMEQLFNEVVEENVRLKLKLGKSRYEN